MQNNSQQNKMSFKAGVEEKFTTRDKKVLERNVEMEAMKQIKLYYQKLLCPLILFRSLISKIRKYQNEEC